MWGSPLFWNVNWYLPLIRDYLPVRLQGPSSQRRQVVPKRPQRTTNLHSLTSQKDEDLCTGCCYMSIGTSMQHFPSAAAVRNSRYLKSALCCPLQTTSVETRSITVPQSTLQRQSLHWHNNPLREKN